MFETSIYRVFDRYSEPCYSNHDFNRSFNRNPDTLLCYQSNFGAVEAIINVCVCIYLNVVRMYLTAVSRIRVCVYVSVAFNIKYIYLINFTVIFRFSDFWI